MPEIQKEPPMAIRTKSMELIREYEYWAREIQKAFYEVATQRFGAHALRGVKRWLVGGRPVTLISVKTGVETSAKGVLGPIKIKGLSAEFEITPNEEPYIAVYNIRPQEQQAVDDFLNAIQRHLDTSSIYKGKAITIFGEFLDLSGVEMETVVYNDKVFRDLRAHVWNLIENAERCNELGITLPRKVLFEGPFGAGKTLAALITAKKAIEHGWTFFYVSPSMKGKSLLETQMILIERYEPAVVFIEDIDREQFKEDPYLHGKVQAALDGAATKNKRVLIITSTNFPDKVTAAMQRPGRTDKIIRFGSFTAEDIKKLLTVTIPPHLLTQHIDWDSVVNACKEFPPAFVKEVGKSATLFALAENTSGDTTQVTTTMLVEAAHDLQSQFQKIQHTIDSGFSRT